MPAPTLPSTEMVRGRPEGLESRESREGRESPMRNMEGAGRQEIRGTRRLSSHRGDIIILSA